MASPKGFLWGGSFSDTQVESGYDYDGRGLFIWDVRQLNEGARSFRYASGLFYHWKEDVVPTAEMGFKTYRMFISWSRILPDSESEINQKGIDFYKTVFTECYRYDIEPIVTILHFDLPLVLEERCGNWNSHRMTGVYVAYYRVLFSEFKEDITYWLTYNKQNMLILSGAVSMTGDSNRAQNLDALYSQARVQPVAQAKATHLCYELYLDAKIEPAPGVITSYPRSCSPIDYIAAMSMDDLRNNFYLDVLILRKYPEGVNHYFELNDIQMYTKEGDFECMRAYHPDFIGLNRYDNDATEYLPYFETDYEVMLHADNREVDYLVKLMDGPGIEYAVQDEYLVNSEADGHSSDPYRIRITTRGLTQCYHLPVLITENGCGREDMLEVDGSVHDS